MLLDGLATRYSTPMKVTIDLSPAQAERLRQEAERLGLTPEDLGRAAGAAPRGTEYYRRAGSCPGAAPDALRHAGGGRGAASAPPSGDRRRARPPGLRGAGVRTCPAPAH